MKTTFNFCNFLWLYQVFFFFLPDLFLSENVFPHFCNSWSHVVARVLQGKFCSEHLEIVSYPHSVRPTLSIDVTNEKHLIEQCKFFADLVCPSLRFLCSSRSGPVFFVNFCCGSEHPSSFQKKQRSYSLDLITTELTNLFFLLCKFCLNLFMQAQRRNARRNRQYYQSFFQHFISIFQMLVSTQAPIV